MGGLMMAAGILAASLICHPIPWAGGWDFLVPLLVALLPARLIDRLGLKWIKR